MRKQVLANFVSSWVSKLVKVFASLVLIPIFISEMGKEGYGLIVLLTTILGFSTLADFGIRTSLVRFLTLSNNRNDIEEFNQHFNTAFAIYLAIWIVLSTFLFVCAPGITHFFKISISYTKDSVFLLRTFGIISLFWSFTTPIVSAITTSNNRFDISTYRETFFGVLSLLSTIVVIKYLHGGLLGWAVVSVVFQVLTTVAIWSISLKYAPRLRLSLKYFRMSLLRPLFSFGAIVSIGGWSRKMKIDSDPLILSAFFGPGAVTIYRTGVSMPSHSRPLIAALCGQMYTVATSLFAQGNKDKFSRLFETASKYTLLMGTLVLIGFLFYSEPFLTLWLGKTLSKTDIHTAALCMQFMAIVDFCFYIEGASYSILYGMNRLWFMAWTDLCLAIANIVTSVLIFKFGHWGIQAVIVPTIVLEGIARPFYLCYTARQINYRLSDVWQKIVFPVIVVFAIAFGSSFVFAHYLSSAILLNFVVCVLMTLIVWAAATWFFGLTTDDRTLIASTVWTRQP